MTEAEYQQLQRDDDYIKELDAHTWLMDNHKRALWVWERHAIQLKNSQFTLMHADFHWDGGYHPYENPEKSTELLGADLDQLKALIEEDVWIRYDSFIVPALLRGRFDTVHFFCKQDDGYDVAIDEEMLKKVGANQILHETVESLAAISPQRPLIFDLCLDLFNRESKYEYGSDLWPDAEIQAFLDAVRPQIEAASLVTVSLSFGCSGSVADTRHLAKYVMPQILALRTQANPVAA
jgi:hypothetical protein